MNRFWTFPSPPSGPSTCKQWERKSSILYYYTNFVVNCNVFLHSILAVWHCFSGKIRGGSMAFSPQGKSRKHLLFPAKRLLSPAFSPDCFSFFQTILNTRQAAGRTSWITADRGERDDRADQHGFRLSFVTQKMLFGFVSPFSGKELGPTYRIRRLHFQCCTPLISHMG